MLRMFTVFLIALSAVLTGDVHDSDSTISTDVNGSVTGTITIPSMGKQQRVFRGRAYRTRQSQGSDKNLTPEQQREQVYINTIISAHPIDVDFDLAPTTPNVQILQRDATFIPEVTVVTQNSTVEFVNDDDFFHNVFSLTRGAKFNIGRRPKGDVYPVVIPATKWKVEGIGQVSLFCDIHSDMNAVIISLDTPFFTRVMTDGTFELPNLPDGTYTLRAYNPKFDVVSQEITISGNNLNLDLSF